MCLMGKNLKSLMELISNVGNKKMLCYLTTLSLAKFLREDPPELIEGGSNSAAVESWKNSDF